MTRNSSSPAPGRLPTDRPAPLTPAMRALVDAAAKVRATPMYRLTPPEARIAYAQRARVLELPKAELARVEDLAIPARDGQPLRARLFAPSHGVLPVLLFLHGGGFTIGSIETHEPLCRELARLSGGAVLSLDYRLAPEHRFPTAVHDTWDALAWLRREAAALGLDATRIAIGGDSAGGTLAAGAAIHAAQPGGHPDRPLALQLLIYPGTTAHHDTPSHRAYAQGYILEAAHIDYFFDHYIPSRTDRDDWRFAPLNAPDLPGLAPAWIGLAECDPLVDEGIAYADKLRAAGVAVELALYPGVVHGFINWGRVIPEARQLHADAAAALRRAWGQALPAAPG